MNISLKTMFKAIDKLKDELIGYQGMNDPVANIEFIQADPGAGQMIDVVRISARAPDRHNKEQEVIAVAELYPNEELKEARISVSKVYVVKP